MDELQHAQAITYADARLIGGQGVAILIEDTDAA